MDNRKERLESMLAQQIQDAENYIDSKIAPDRAKAYEFYYGELPAAQKNKPSIVKKVVFEKIQAALSQIKEPFLSGRDIVKFVPFNANDGEGASIASSVVNKILKSENNVDKIYTGLILDGLIAKSGTIKVYWEDKHTYEEEYFDNLSKDALDELLSEDDVELVEKEEVKPEFNLQQLIQMFPNFPINQVYPMGFEVLKQRATSWETLAEEIPQLKETLNTIVDQQTYYRGTIEREIDSSSVCIKNVAPENFLINESAVDIKSASFVAEKAKVTASELYEMGFKKDIIDNLNYNESVLADIGTVQQSRNSFDSTDALFNTNSTKCVVLYECYVETSLVKYSDSVGKPTKLYQMYYADGQLLGYSEVDRVPFFTWCPLPVPHKFFGQSMAETLFAEQELSTTALRGAIQYLSFSVNPRYKAIGGAEYNLAAFQSNLPGSIVPITKGDLIPFEYPRLDQSIFQLMDVIAQSSNSVSGVSNMSGGLNSEALKANVSATAVQIASDESTRRIKEYALQLANNAIKPAYQYVYELFRKNADDKITVQISGKDVEVDPKALPHRSNLDIDYSLGRNDQLEHALNLIQMRDRINQNPQLKQLQTVDQSYNLEYDIMNSTGIYDANRYLTTPRGKNVIQDPATQQQQQQQMELQKKQLEQQAMQLQIQQQQLMLEKTKIENDFAIAKEKLRLESIALQQKITLEKDKLEFDQEQAADQQALKEQELEADIVKTTAEIKMESMQQRGVDLG